MSLFAASSGSLIATPDGAFPSTVALPEVPITGGR
jgi:hypothetical protein